MVSPWRSAPSNDANALSHVSRAKTARFGPVITMDNSQPMLEVEITGLRGPTTTGSGRNGLDL